jgi:hypothetical protein
LSIWVEFGSKYYDDILIIVGGLRFGEYSYWECVAQGSIRASGLSFEFGSKYYDDILIILGGLRFGEYSYWECVAQGSIRASLLSFKFGGQHYDDILITLLGLHNKYAVQRECWVSIQNLLWDRGKILKILIDFALRTQELIF